MEASYFEGLDLTFYFTWIRQFASVSTSSVVLVFTLFFCSVFISVSFCVQSVQEEKRE